jgi:hypothetical protein
MPSLRHSRYRRGGEMTGIGRRASPRPFLPRWYLGLPLLCVGVVGIFLICLSIGAVPIRPWQALRILIDRLWPLTPTWAPSEQIIILHVRAPRILLAASVGAALAVAGTVFQALLRNPLADPLGPYASRARPSHTPAHCRPPRRCLIDDRRYVGAQHYRPG